MAAPTNSDTELLTEHFGYPPVSLIDDLINSINILAERALNSVEQGLLNLPPATLGFKAPRGAPPVDPPPDYAELAKTEIESGTHQLETLLCTSIDRNFDKLELYVLRNILCVTPPDVRHVNIRNYLRLGHYHGLDFSSPASPAGADGENGDAHGDRPTLESIGQLRKRLRESMRLNALLSAEQERNARLLTDMRALLGMSGASEVKRESSVNTEDAQEPGPLAFLHRQVGALRDAGPDTPLSTTTAFTLSQLQALRALSTSLRTMTPDLAPSDKAEDEDGGEGARKSWRRERVEYVESATRRHLETVQGLELGKDGEVRDGEWQSEGRKLDKGEVEGLEGLVAALSGEGGPASAREGRAGDDDAMDES